MKHVPALVALVAALFTPSAQALAQNTAGTSCLVDVGDRVVQQPFNAQQAFGRADSSCFVTTIVNIGDVGGYAQGISFANYQQLYALAFAAVTPTASAAGRSVASFTDTLTVFGSGLAEGTPGVATATWVINGGEAGVIRATDVGSAEARVTFTGQIPDGTGVVTGDLYDVISADGTRSSGRDPIPPMTFHFEFGRPFVFTAMIEATAQVTEGGARVYGSALWGGFSFQAFAGADLVPVAANVVAESGTDWNRSLLVPEPATYLLMLAGLVMVALFRWLPHSMAPAITAVVREPAVDAPSNQAL